MQILPKKEEKEEATFIVKPSPEILKNLPKITKKVIAEQQAELAQKDWLLKKQAEDIERLKDGTTARDYAILKAAQERKELVGRIKKQKRTAWFLKQKEPIILRTSDKQYLRNRDGVEFPYLKAVEFEAKPEGGYSTILVVSTKDGKFGEVESGVSLAELASNIAHQMSTGLVEINFDSKFRWTGWKFSDSAESHQLMVQKAFQELEDEITEKEEAMAVLRRQKGLALKREEKTRQELDDSDTARDLAAYALDHNRGQTKGIVQTVKSIFDDHAAVLTAAQTSQVNRALSKAYTDQLEGTIDEQAEKVAAKMGEDTRSRAQWEAIEAYKEGQMDAGTPPQPKKKEETEEPEEEIS